MNPWTPIQTLMKAFTFIVSLPFMIIALILQGVGMLLAGFVSVAAMLLALGTVAVVIAALAAGPWLYYQNSRTGETRRAHGIVQLRDGRVLRHREFSFVGPDGRRLEWGTDEGARSLADGIAPQAEAEGPNDFEFLGPSTTVPEVAVVEQVEAASADAMARATDRLEQAIDEPVPPEPAPPTDPDRPRPDWVDDLTGTDLSAGRLIVKGEQCESAEACQVAYRDALDRALCEYVRNRAEICLADLHVVRMPWHEVTIQRIAQNLRVQPKDEYLDIHDTELGGGALRTYLQYGLLEISPAVRDHVDGEITRWTRSFQAASCWGMALSAAAGLYLAIKANLAGRIARRWKRSSATPTVAST